MCLNHIKVQRAFSSTRWQTNNSTPTKLRLKKRSNLLEMMNFCAFCKRMTIIDEKRSVTNVSCLFPIINIDNQSIEPTKKIRQSFID